MHAPYTTNIYKPNHIIKQSNYDCKYENSRYAFTCNVHLRSPDGNNWKIGADSAELFAQNVDINLRAVGCGIGFQIPNVVKKGLFVYISFYGL